MLSRIGALYISIYRFLYIYFCLLRTSRILVLWSWFQHHLSRNCPFKSAPAPSFHSSNFLLMAKSSEIAECPECLGNFGSQGARLYSSHITSKSPNPGKAQQNWCDKYARAIKLIDSFDSGQKLPLQSITVIFATNLVWQLQLQLSCSSAMIFIVGSPPGLE